MTLAALPLLAQTKVSSFFSGVNEGVTYYLPDTKIEVSVNAACITRTPGEFHRYAERYLRIDNAILEMESHWVMTGVDVTTSGKPNSDKMYTIRLNSSPAGNVSLCKNGIIESINIYNKKEQDAKEILPTSTSRHCACA